MNILVTGGAGFIGSHIADALIAKGHRVVIADDFSTGRREHCNPAATIVECSIVDQRLESVMEEYKPEVVIHCAAQMDVRRSVADPVFDATVNILGTIRLLAYGSQNGLRRFIFCSSGGAIYGDAEHLPTPESETCTPTSPYGISKFAGEQYLRYYGQSYGIVTTALRFGNVYGPRQRADGEGGVVAIFTSKLLNGIAPTINGDGKQTRDYVYVSDVVKAAIAALECERSGTYNIATGIETDVNTLYKEIAHTLTSALQPFYGPPKAGEQRRSCLTIAYARQEINWVPEYELDEGIEKTVQWFKDNLKKQ